MVDVRAKATGKKKQTSEEKTSAVDPVVAALMQFNMDWKMVDIAAHELRERHEDLWVGGCYGELHVDKTLRAVLEHFGAIGHPEVPLSVMFVSADGQLKTII